jgi:hypothetical protein
MKGQVEFRYSEGALLDNVEGVGVLALGEDGCARGVNF